MMRLQTCQARRRRRRTTTTGMIGILREEQVPILDHIIMDHCQNNTEPNIKNPELSFLRYKPYRYCVTIPNTVTRWPTTSGINYVHILYFSMLAFWF